MGQAIVNAIKSGFSILGDLAQNVLTAFQTLVWDGTANSGAGALTGLGEFAFTLLGISVVFSVLMLVFSLLRGNTGM